MDEKLEKELNTLADAEDYQGIVDLLGDSLVGDPSTLEQWLVPSLIKLGQYTEAEVKLGQLSDKDTGTWWYLRSWIYHEEGNLLDAREAIEKAELLRKKEGKDPIDSPDESLDFQMHELESLILCGQFSVWEAKNESKKIVDTILAFPEEKRNEWAIG